MGSSRAEQEAVPQRIGRYDVLVPIASGGMATVYLARSHGAAGFERDVAIKLTHRHLKDAPEFEAVLVEEAKLASAIRHHNVVTIVDVGDDPLGLFLVMEYVEGDTLSGLLRRARASGEPMPRNIALKILCDALAGLHAAHETCDPSSGRSLGLVHRDFSPQNILVGTDGIARLTDFGIAKATARLGHNTATGIIKGKAAYMAPEQVRAQPLDRRSDIWAAGVVAWELLAGRPMWPRDIDDVALLFKIVMEPPPRLHDFADVDQGVADVVMTALEQDPAKRFPTASAFAKALVAATRAWEPATSEDVEVFVRAAAGAKLEQRRVRIAEVRQLRDKLDVATSATLATPSGEGLAIVEVEATAPNDAVRTDMMSTVVPTNETPRARRRWVLVVASIAAVGVATAGAVTLSRHTTSSVAASPTSAGEPVTLAPTSTASSSATATAATATATSPEPAVTQPSASAPIAQTSTPRATVAKPNAPPPPPTARLAKNPYAN